jgi:MFS family permease
MNLVARRRGYRVLVAGEVVSYAGDWLTYVAVSVLALHEGDSLLALAAVLVAHSLPHAVLAPMAGVVVDRLDRRWVLVGTATLQGVAAMVMAVAAAGGAFWLLQVALLVRVSIGAFFSPAASAALPRLVRPDEVPDANALSAGIWSVMFTAGTALGGVAAAVLGPVVAIGLDAVTFALAAVILSRLPAMRPERAPSQGAVSDLSEAVRFAWRRPRVLEAVLGKTPLAIAGGGAWVAMNALSASAALAGSAALTIGLVTASRGLGTAIGPFVANRVARRSASAAWTLAALATFAGIGAFAVSGGVAALVVTGLIWGAGTGANWVLTTTRLQVEAPDALRGRLAALDVLAFTLGQTSTAVAGAYVGTWLGSPAAAAWVGLAAGVAAWVALRAFVQLPRIDAWRVAPAAMVRM